MSDSSPKQPEVTDVPDNVGLEPDVQDGKLLSFLDWLKDANLVMSPTEEQEYFAWLQDWMKEPAEENMVCLYQLSADPTVNAGWRHVSKATCAKKAAMFWSGRNWGPMMAFVGGETGLMTFAKGHQRVATVHTMCRWCMQSSEELSWLKEMAKNIPGQVHQITKAGNVSRHYTTLLT